MELIDIVLLILLYLVTVSVSLTIYLLIALTIDSFKFSLICEDLRDLGFNGLILSRSIEKWLLKEKNIKIVVGKDRDGYSFNIYDVNKTSRNNIKYVSSKVFSTRDRAYYEAISTAVKQLTVTY